MSASAQPRRIELPITGVERIRWEAIGELRITQGSPESLIVEAEEQLLPKIKAELRNHTLLLGFGEPQISTKEPIRFHLTVKVLTEIESRSSGTFSIRSLRTPRLALRLAGSGDTTIGSLFTDRLNIEIIGASNVTIEDGSVETQQVEIAGSGDYEAVGLQSKTVSLLISGSGNATIAAAKRLIARITGAGEIRYLGDPDVTEIVDGAGQVQRLMAR
jgi:hypothetical protein